MTQALSLLAIVAMMTFSVIVVTWVWRDMGERTRPRWLRALVLLTANVFVLGFVIYVVDLRRHPHDPNLSGMDVLLQRYRHRLEPGRA